MLGTLIANEKSSANALEVLSEAVFTTPANRAVYKASKALSRRLEPIDVYTVRNEVGKNGELEALGDSNYPETLVAKSNPRVVETYVALLKEANQRRELKAIGEWLQNKSEDVTIPCEDLRSELETRTHKLKGGVLDSNMRTVTNILVGVLKQIENRKNSKDGMTGIPSGFAVLDRVTNGWPKGSFTIVGGRPAMGKSAFLIEMARRVAVDFDKPIAYFSLELTAEQVTERLIGSVAGLDAKELRSGNLSMKSWNKLHERVSRLSDSTYFIDDTPGLTLFDFRDKCRRLKARSNIELVVVDYLQLMKFSGARFNNRERELGEICKGIKNIARELDIAIVASSQLSRAVETRGGDKRPMLSDLRESGSLEQDADQVLFLYRAEYYGIDEDWDGRSTNGIAEVIVSKNRFGQTGMAKLRFQDQTASFSDLEPYEEDSDLMGLRKGDFT